MIPSELSEKMTVNERLATGSINTKAVSVDDHYVCTCCLNLEVSRLEQAMDSDSGTEIDTISPD